MPQRMPRSATEVQTQQLLVELETALKSAQLWSSNSPSDWAMSSTAPFACDRMDFEQWLQFIFIPTLTRMLEQQLPLPSKIGLVPMAHERCKTLGALRGVLSSLAKFDRVLGGTRN